MNVMKPGTRLPKSIPCFPESMSKRKKQTQTEEKMSAIKPAIDIDKLAAVDLRVGTIVHAEAIPRAKKCSNWKWI